MSVLEFLNNKEEKTKRNFMPVIAVSNMNESQKQVIKEIEKNIITTVIGAAGTGKTSTIVNIACYYIMTNRKVLIVSKSDHACNVVCEKLNNLNCGIIAVRGGKAAVQTEMTNYLMDILENKINCDYENINIVQYLLNKNTENARKLLKKKKIENIKELMNNYESRKNLLIQAKNGNEKKKSIKDKIIKTIDFEPILKALPCFCVTTAEISDVLPLKKDLFDIVIVDESSEVDIASFLPCAYRAKKCVVIGDDKQLKSLNWLDNKKNKTFLTKYEIPAELQLIWNYRNNSLFDFMQYYTQKCILLNEQYRMPENLFKFSNDKFYGGSIKSYKKADKEALKKVFVENAKTTDGKTINFAEAKEIVLKIKELVKNNDNKSIFVLSPFRHQVDLIQKLISEVITYDLIEKHNIRVLTFNESQGAESDIVLISWVIAENTPHQSMTFINEEHRFNVGISRAKELLINYYSTKKLKGLINEYLCSIPED